jgi:hypothetical protein
MCGWASARRCTAGHQRRSRLRRYRRGTRRLARARGRSNPDRLDRRVAATSRGRHQAARLWTGSRPWHRTPERRPRRPGRVRWAGHDVIAQAARGTRLPGTERSPRWPRTLPPTSPPDRQPTRAPEARSTRPGLPDRPVTPQPPETLVTTVIRLPPASIGASPCRASRLSVAAARPALETVPEPCTAPAALGRTRRARPQPLLARA